MLETLVLQIAVLGFVLGFFGFVGGQFLRYLKKKLRLSNRLVVFSLSCLLIVGAVLNTLQVVDGYLREEMVFPSVTFFLLNVLWAFLAPEEKKKNDHTAAAEQRQVTTFSVSLEGEGRDNRYDDDHEKCDQDWSDLEDTRPRIDYQ